MASGGLARSGQRLELAAALDVAEDAWMAAPVVWGRSDCILSCADVLRTVLGFDPAARWRGRYTTPRGYLRVLRREGFDALEDALKFEAATFGWRRIDPQEAEPGDVGLAAHLTGRSCLLAKAGGFWVGRRDYGVGVLPARQIDIAWSVLPC